MGEAPETPAGHQAPDTPGTPTSVSQEIPAGLRAPHTPPSFMPRTPTLVGAPDIMAGRRAPDTPPAFYGFMPRGPQKLQLVFEHQALHPTSCHELQLLEHRKLHLVFERQVLHEPLC